MIRKYITASREIVSININYLSKDSLSILYGDCAYIHTVLYAKPSRFYLSLIQAAASWRVKGNNDLSSESRCLRTSTVAGVYLLRSQIGDTIFSNFIYSPDSLSESERACATIPFQGTKPFPALFFCSVFLRFSLEYPTRDPPRNCNTAIPVCRDFV